MLTEGMRTKLADYNAVLGSDTAAKKRLAALFDDGTYTEIDAYAKNGKDLSGVCAAYGFANGMPVYAFSQDRTVKSGAVTKVQAAKICKVLSLAAKNGLPVVGIYDSCGAYVEEGADALNAYSEILKGVGNLSGVVPQISVIAGICSGSASVIAESADIVVMSEKAELYMFAGKEEGSAKDAMKSGIAAVAAKDDIEAVKAAKKLIGMFPSNNLSAVPEFEYSESGKAPSGDAVKIAAGIADENSVTELYSDFGKASYTALATVSGRTVGIAATNKTADKLNCRDCTKLSDFVKLCDAFSIPIITVTDTEGFDPECKRAVRSAVNVSNAYAEATTVKISLITGKAYGAAYTAFAGVNAGADATFAYEDAVISPVDPVSAAEFLYHDELKGASDVKAKRKELAARYTDEFCTAVDAASKGAVDEVIAPEKAREAVISALDIFSGKRMLQRLPKKHGTKGF